jgi:Cysteine-rich CPXCG
MDQLIVCPYCGETIEIWVDPGGGESQRYVEDCQVCCRPIELTVSADEDGEPLVSANRSDE